MGDERMRILEMVRDGKITAEEGVRLLEAVQPKAASSASSTPGASGAAGAGGARGEWDDPLGMLATAVAEAFQSGNWKNLGGLVGSFAGSWSSGPLAALERKREREAEGWEFLPLSGGDSGTFTLPEGAEVTVEHEAGSVEAASGDAARLDLEGEATHNFGVYVARKDQQVVIACHRTAPFARMPRLKLTLPASVKDVTLRTAGGSLTAERFSVPLRLKTAGGSIRVREQRGAEVHARTAGGGIKVDGTPAKIDLHTSGGSIKFEGRTEAIQVKTSGGSIDIDGAHLTAGEHEAKTSGGSVRIRLARASSVEVEAKTSAGTIAVELPGAEGERTGSRISPRYRGRYNGGAARLHVATAAGSVTLGLGDDEKGGASEPAPAPATAPPPSPAPAAESGAPAEHEAA